MKNTNSTNQTSLKKSLNKLDPNLTRVFFTWALRHPRYIRSFIRFSRAHRKIKILREDAQANGFKVPPFLILSITPHCNLQCSGCFAAAVGAVYRKDKRNEDYKKAPLNWEQWRTIIAEARELGVFGFVIAGGEPFMFPNLIELCREFPDRFFLILTNGTAIKAEDYKRIKRADNIGILISLEGNEAHTDARRGKGTYKQAMTTLMTLNKLGTLTGISVTITRLNHKYWMNEQNIEYFIKQGIRIGAFIEYIPTTMDNDHGLMLNSDERMKFRKKMLDIRETQAMYLIHSPGDEEFFGGCVSAGRGFAHITPQGDLTPCPVSNIATHNLLNSTLREGLASPLFQEIRDNEHLLETEGVPCALFAHPKEVDELAKAVGAYRTGMD